MEILWPALGIAAIVCVVFYALASHWHKLLRQQSWTIRRLGERIQMLEEIADPEFRRRLSESSPLPLEQVFTFSFRLTDHFWHETLHIKASDREFVQRLGTFVGSLKLERWRSHTVATITEVLPEDKTARWQTRSLDFYRDAAKGYDSLSLWELRLAPSCASVECPPSIELILRRDAIELWGHRISRMAETSGNGRKNGSAGRPDKEETLLLRVPLDASLLEEFRSNDPVTGQDDESENSAPEEAHFAGRSWREFYSYRDNDLEWQLRLRDLTKKADWERWRILHADAVRISQPQQKRDIFGVGRAIR